jgi:hypothetical protein
MWLGKLTKRLLFDIETDGLLVTVSKAWIVGFKDKDTGEIKKWLNGDEGWRVYFDQARLLIGHNIIGYDLPALKKIFGWVPNPQCNIHDTLLMSQAQNYRRFLSGRHSLEEWGIFFGDHKGEYDDWSQYTPEMAEYWEQDIKLTDKVYEFLLKEYRVIAGRNGHFKKSLQNEHAVAKFAARASEIGWKFDRRAGEQLLIEMELAMVATEAIIVPKLKIKTVATDKVKGVVHPKKPKWLKNGNYDAHTCRFFEIDPETGSDEDFRLVEGPYSRIEFVNPTMKNLEDVKEFLYSIGWEPDDWNLKKDENGTWVKVSPKLSESSLLALGKDGELLNDYTTTKSRHSILKGWLEALDDNDRLHGGCFTIATPTGRARHSGLVNVPGADAPWGKQIRSLFVADPGYKVIGADSSGNQFRALCHYLRNPDYTDLVLNGDVHQENANTLTAILRELSVYDDTQTVSRKTAKPFIYAFLFGAGGEKLSLIVLGRRSKTIGNKLKNEFIKRVPGLKDLVERVTARYYASEKKGKPWIPGIDGRRIYCDSPHKALNYLLQDFEAISCKAAVAYMMDKLEAEEIPWIPLIWYHDEMEIAVPEEYAARAREICVEGHRNGGKDFGMMILDGAGKIGDSWYDVH